MYIYCHIQTIIVMSYYIYIVNLMTTTMKMGTVLDNGKTHFDILF